MLEGPIMIIDDDVDDHCILKDALEELGVPNPVICFDGCEPAMAYLLRNETQPFFIICDINLPRQTGLEFKRQIDTSPALRRRSIPFIFYSTFAGQEIVNEAYMNLTVQGFFRKSISYEDIKDDLRAIITYWSKCVHPNTR
jgi:CheY-like chemotaxis protein